MRPLIALVSSLGLFGGLLTNGLDAGAPPPDTDKAIDARLLALCRHDIQNYTIVVGRDHDKLKCREVMTWSNPVRDRQLGVVCLWLRGGRAEAIGTVFTHPRAQNTIQLQHEMQSLSEETLQATFGKDELRWAPAQPGIVLARIVDAPPPGDSAGARQRQMRALAREFSGHSIDRNGSRWELRLLAQPLYRYEEATATVLDGAIFSFISTAGTDPEIVLLIEARKDTSDWAWYFAAARFSDQSLYLSHKEREVWRFENVKGNVEYSAGMKDTYRFIFDRMIDPSKDPLVEAAP